MPFDIVEDFYPPFLTCLPIWVLWRKEARKSGNGVAKVPYQTTGYRAASDNPETWTDFPTAYNALNSSGGLYDGVGVMMSHGLVFVDIDHCICDGKVNDIGRDVLLAFMDEERQFPIFAEISQSGGGVHIITVGKIAGCFKNSKAGVEMYDAKRFCALTGKSFIRTAEAIPQPDALEYIFAKYNTGAGACSPESPPPPQVGAATIQSDRWIVEHASQSERFANLYAGNWGEYGSHSDADFALCKLLAFWANNDPTTIDRIFRTSGLFRLKWCRKDYSRRTIERAIMTNDDTIAAFTRRKHDERIKQNEWWYQKL